MPRKSRDRSISQGSTQKARQAWMVPDGKTSVRERLRIPTDLIGVWDSQSSDDRGLAWAIGCILSNPVASYVVSQNEVTVIAGQRSATGATQYEAVLALVQSYGYQLPKPSPFATEMDDLLNNLGLLE